MRPADAYATGLALLGAWGAFTSAELFKPGRPWSRWRSHLFLTELLFTGSCLIGAIALMSSRFPAWVFVPLGVSYLLMIPAPCYFPWVDRIGWLHVARNVLFGMIAAVCFALAFGLVPASVLGI